MLTQRMQEAHSLSDTKRALLDRYLRGVGFPAPETIGRRPPGSIAPLSAAQEELYRRELRVPNIPSLYNECVNLRMLGPLDVVALERAFNEIIKRQEAWRTTFETEAGQPAQIVHPFMPVQLPVVDLQRMPDAEREAAALRLISEDVRRPFDLRCGPLLRPKLVRISETEHRLFLTAHQIVLDGVSAFQLFPSELAAFYKGLLARKSVTLPELQVQCAAFAAVISLQPPMPNLDLAWSVTTMDMDSGGSPWDFYLAFIDTPHGLIGRAQFNPDLFDTKTIGRALEDLQDVLGSASQEAFNV